MSRRVIVVSGKARRRGILEILRGAARQPGTVTTAEISNEVLGHDNSSKAEVDRLRTNLMAGRQDANLRNSESVATGRALSLAAHSSMISRRSGVIVDSSTRGGSALPTVS